MHIEVNLETCQGIGLCELHASAVFEVSPAGYAALLAGAITPDEEELVRTAVDKCPTGSIRIIDEVH